MGTELISVAQSNDSERFLPLWFNAYILFVPEIAGHDLEIDGLRIGTKIDELIGAIDWYPVQQVAVSLKCHASIIPIVVLLRAAMD